MSKPLDKKHACDKGGTSRRTFLQSAAAVGLSVFVPPLFLPNEARAARYGGPFWLFVNAQGGWDPRFLFDPSLAIEQNRLYTSVKQVGAFSVAPIPVDLARVGLATDQGLDTYLLSAEAFATAHGQQMLVLNGIDTATNNHDAGVRTMSCGRLSEGYPALAGLIAAVKGPDRPMAFLSGGGYDATNGHIPLSRVSGADALARIARPNDLNPTDVKTEHYHSAATMTRIMELQHARIDAQRAHQSLPRLQRSIDALRAARDTTAELSDLVIAETLVDLPGGLDDLERFERQVQLSYAAFEAGLSVCASVTLGGFDTHGNHDHDQTRQQWKLLGGVDFALRHAAEKGLADKLFVVVTSDFARGPEYNGNNDGSGKDHWPITSMLAFGPGIAGNRVIGATDDGQRPLKLNASSLATDDAGVTLGPADIHRALRKLAGVDATELAGLYPLVGEDLPIFG
jgi:hypothetical protein